MSITLTTGTNVVINGVQVENDTTGGIVSMDVDYIGSTVTFVLRTGTIVNNNLNAGIYGPTITLQINLITGAWKSSDGRSGTVPATPLANINAQFKNDRNAVETFAAGASGIMPGVQVAWT